MVMTNLKSWASKKLLELSFAVQSDIQYKIANDDKTKEEIYHFRYDIYVEELGREPDGCDPKLKRVKDELDDSPYARQYYLKEKNEIVAAIRVVIFPPNEMIPEFKEHYHLTNLPWMNQYSICEVSYVVVDKTMRSSLFFSRLLSSIFNILVNEVEFVVATCKPYLLKKYLLLGCNLYSDRYVEWADGIQIPIMWVIHNKYAKMINSPFKRIDLSRQKRKVTEEHINFFLQKPKALLLDQEEIRAKLRALQFSSDFLEISSPTLIDLLIERGCYLMSIEQPTKIIHRKMKDRTLYLLLNGSATVHFEEDRIEVDSGSLLGTFSYFQDIHKETCHEVDVTCNHGHLLVIKKSALKDLSRGHMQEYIAFLHFAIKNELKLIKLMKSLIPRSVNTSNT